MKVFQKFLSTKIAFKTMCSKYYFDNYIKVHFHWIFILQRSFFMKGPRVDPIRLIFNYTQVKVLVDILYESLIIWYIFRFSILMFWSELPRMLRVSHFSEKILEI